MLVQHFLETADQQAFALLVRRYERMAQGSSPGAPGSECRPLVTPSTVLDPSSLIEYQASFSLVDILLFVYFRTASVLAV